MVKVGILGSGDVGKVLAKGFLKNGYQVAIGSDHPEKLTEFKRENPEWRLLRSKKLHNPVIS